MVGRTVRRLTANRVRRSLGCGNARDPRWSAERYGAWQPTGSGGRWAVV